MVQIFFFSFLLLCFSSKNRVIVEKLDAFLKPLFQVFTCLALFNTLISPLNSFPWVINGLIDVSCPCSCSILMSFDLSYGQFHQEMVLDLKAASFILISGDHIFKAVEQVPILL